MKVLAAAEAQLAANDPKPRVFCPPLATFRPDANGRAREEDILEAPALSVEIDANARAGVERLKGVLGPPTFVIRSGGVSTNPETGESEDKLHWHSRLKKPACGALAIGKLKEARRLATALVGGDPSNVNPCHPIRWPGSLHRKAEPRLCEIIESNIDREIDLDEALIALEAVTPGRAWPSNRTHNGNGDAADRQAPPEYVAEVVSHILNPDLPWDKWNYVALAIYGATGGADEGIEILDSFSRKSSKYNERRTRERWRGLVRSPPNRIGIGTLEYLARQADPDWENEFDRQTLAKQRAWRDVEIPPPADLTETPDTSNAEPPYKVLSPAAAGERCTLCGKGTLPTGERVSRIKHGTDEDLWHESCASHHFKAMADPLVKIPDDLGPDPFDEHGAPVLTYKSEIADRAAFSGEVQIIGMLAVAEAPDRAMFADANYVTLVANEASDTAAFSGGVQIIGILAASEKSDRAVFVKLREKPPPRQTELIRPSTWFVWNFQPPDYLIDGLLQRRFLYSFTGLTGAGKTTIALRATAHVAYGLTLPGRFVEKGKVLYLAGENPDDTRMKWIKLCEEMQLDPNTEMVHWLEGHFYLNNDNIWRTLMNDCRTVGPFSLVVVDTATAYFTGDKENDNKQAATYARELRRFTQEAEGGPTVLVPAHPPKNAPPENLLPRGGGAFLNEMDGNLTCVKREQIAEVHWLGKFRGPEFAPLSFLLKRGTTDKLKDSKGRHIWTVTAEPLGREARATLEAANTNDEDQLLKLLVDQPRLSMAGMAETMQWFYGNGEPNKSRVQRIFETLKNDHLAKKVGDHFEATNAGKTKAETIVANRPNPSERVF